jgi:hypothetical protein
VQSAIPDGDDKVRVADGQRAGQVHGVGATQGVFAGELASMAFDRGGQLHRTARCPVLLPCLLGVGQLVLAQVLVTGGRGQRGSDLGIGQSARDGGVAAIPQPNFADKPGIASELPRLLASLHGR